MSPLLEKYVDRVLLYADRREEDAARIRQELADHLLQKVEDLLQAGHAREDAILTALRDHGHPREIGYRMRAPFRLIDVRMQGTARGVIAIGPRAVGVVAFGGVAIGVIAIGGVAIGLLGMGGLALGLLLAWGGLALGGIAYGGVAIGLAAAGGLAIGLVASGALGIGLWVPEAAQKYSLYTALTTPEWLKTVAQLHAVPAFVTRYIWIFMPLYLLVVGALSLINVMEGIRLQKLRQADENWLLEP